MRRVGRVIHDRLRAAEIPLFVVTFVLGAYLAVGNIFDAANVPRKSTWTPWSIWFVALLAAAVWVPLFALYQTVEARRQSRARLETQATRDLALACQQIVAVIADTCAKVAVNDLAACVWKCRADGGFDESARFYLPHHRPPTGVSWHKGKGVAGWAWETNTDHRSDLQPLIARL
jgi:VanZ family protein